jgi:capsular exopolysaccharide synthesis family protein
MSRVSEAMSRVGEPATTPAAEAAPGPRVRPATPLDRFGAETGTPIAATQPARAPVRVEPRTRPIEQSLAARNPKLIVHHEMQQSNGLKVVMVSSAVPREGKTLTVANLALTLSESYHRRVLAIDADLRRPRLHELFGMSKAPGLADVLASPSFQFPLVQASAYLSVLTAGQPSTSPLAQLASDRLRTSIDEVAAHFDWVLIDTPPISLMPDAQHVASVSQGVLLVIAAGATPYPLVQRAVASIGAERIVGTMLNHADPALVAGDRDYGRYLGTDLPRS